MRIGPVFCIVALILLILGQPFWFIALIIGLVLLVLGY